MVKASGESARLSLETASTGATTAAASSDENTLDLDRDSRPSRDSAVSSGSGGGRASNYSRRSSDFDDSAKPLAPDRETSKLRRVVKGLPCATLRFSDLGLVGRERELEALNKAYGRASGRRSNLIPNSLPSDGALAAHTKVTEPSMTKELVLIAGSSGCGKSRLASTLSDRVERTGGKGWFVRGKYDLYLRDEPYFGIAQACGAMVGKLLQLRESEASDDTAKFDEVRDELKREIRDEAMLLANVVPSIAELVGEDDCSPRRDEGAAGGGGLEQSRERFHLAFRKFVRIVSDVKVFGAPLVIMLDDLQWADVASIELLKILTEFICDERGKSGPRLTVTELDLEHLSVLDVNRILEELLSTDDADKTMPLAELCHRRCIGNPFHLVEFLRMLEEEGLLSFNLGSFRWSFDVDLIEEKTSAASNIVEMVTARLEQLPDPLQDVLNIAACLGSSFDVDLLHLVWRDLKGEEGSERERLEAHLAEAVEGRILEADSDSAVFRWTHDKVQEASSRCDLDAVNINDWLVDRCERVG